MTPPDAIQVLRGGSWGDFPTDCRSAARDRLSQAVCAFGAIGFRVVCLPLEVKPAPIVSRGGAWCNCFFWKMRSSSRGCCRPHRADDLDGFRVVCLQAAPRGLTWLA